MDILHLEKKPSNEESNTESVPDFFRLNSEETKTLKLQIEKNAGSIRIMVHPYYLEQNKGLHPDRNTIKDQRINIVESGFEKILRTKLNTPIFLFEDKDEIQRTTQKIIPLLQEIGNKVYVVKTENDASRPVDGWDSFIQNLKRLKVRKIIIGGIFLNILTYDEEEVLTGCVGRAIEKLEGNFEEIQISNLAHPKSRKDFLQPSRKSKY